MTPEDEKKADEYWYNRRLARKTMMATCYAGKSQAAANLLQTLGSVDDVTAKLNAVLTSAAGQIDGNVDRLVGNIGEINGMLSGEATRLGVELPAGGLPDPAKLANAISGALKGEINKLLTTERGKRDVAQAAMDIRSDGAEELYRAQRDINKARKDLAKEAGDVARDLGELGLSVSEADITNIGNAVIGQAEGALNSGLPIKEALHEANGMIRDVTGLDLPLEQQFE